MSTYTAVHFETCDFIRVGKILEGNLEANFPEREIRIHTSAVLPIYGAMFTHSERPTAFSYAQCPKGWCTAHFNYFSELENFANDSSRALQARVVVLNVQTTSCCYYLGLHEQGVRRRAFAYADGNWSLQEGSLLPFEIDTPLDSDIRESDIVRFCAGLNLPIGTSECYPDTWTHIQIVEPPTQKKAKEQSSRPSAFQRRLSKLRDWLRRGPAREAW